MYMWVPGRPTVHVNIFMLLVSSYMSGRLSLNPLSHNLFEKLLDSKDTFSLLKKKTNLHNRVKSPIDNGPSSHSLYNETNIPQK